MRCPLTISIIQIIEEMKTLKISKTSTVVAPTGNCPRGTEGQCGIMYRTT